MTGSLEASLYFHIPFCQRKCSYCHFYVIPEREESKEVLLEGLQRELSLYASHLKDKAIVSLYFGGGTPSLFGPERVGQIIDQVSKFCHIPSSAEITLEANPENISQQLIKEYAKAGINRVSIGIQTLDIGLLNLLGRLHDAKTARNAVINTYHAGIDNISVDLMYDLPKQTIEQWSSTLEQAAQLPIQHLSLYNLTFEPHTLFYKQEAQLRPLLPDEGTSLAMYEMAVEKMEMAGLKQYEISAFAKPASESRHNTGYWTGRAFLGLGPSAFSYWQGKRFRNIAHLKKYSELLKSGKAPLDFEEALDPEAARRELFVIQLRLLQGISLETFASKHGGLDKATYHSVERLVSEGFLHLHEGRIRLTKKGILFYDTIASELI